MAAFLVGVSGFEPEAGQALLEADAPTRSPLTRVPVAVSDIFLANGVASSAIDRGHSLCFLYLPLAAVASLPARGWQPRDLGFC